MNNDAKPNSQVKRWHLIVMPSFQWKYIAFIVVGVFLTSCIMGFSLYSHLFDQARARLIALTPVTPAQTGTSIIFASLLLAIIPAGAFGLISVVLTHRICGPVIAMQSTLKKLRDGTFPRRRGTRKRDEFKGVTSLLGDAVASLKSGKEADLTEYQTIEKIARSGMNRNATDTAKALEEVLKRTRQLCRKAEIALGIENDSDGASSEPSKPQDASASPRELASSHA